MNLREGLQISHALLIEVRSFVKRNEAVWRVSGDITAAFRGHLDRERKGNAHIVYAYLRYHGELKPSMKYKNPAGYRRIRG